MTTWTLEAASCRLGLSSAVAVVIRSTRHYRHLELLDLEHPASNPAYLAVLEAKVPGDTAPALLTHSPHRARLDQVRACPHRGERFGSDCGCLHTCRTGKGSLAPGQVSLSDCLACIRDEG